MQNSQYFYDGIDSYLYSLVHYSGTRPNNNGIRSNNIGTHPNNNGTHPNNNDIRHNNIGTYPNNIGTHPNNTGNYQQSYRNTNMETQYYNNSENRYNDYARQNIAVNPYNNFNRYDNRYGNFDNELALNNRYYNNQQSIQTVQQQHSRQRLQNPYYNQNHWNRYPQNNNYARSQVQTQFERGFQELPRTRPNRQISRAKSQKNMQQIPGNNLMMFDSSQNTAPSNPNNAKSTENSANQQTDLNQRTDSQKESTETIDLFQIDTQADLSNLEKIRLDENLPIQIISTDTNVVQPPESTSADTNFVKTPESISTDKSVVQPLACTSVDSNVVQEIITAFSNASQENIIIQSVALHKDCQTTLNIPSKEPLFPSNCMSKLNKKTKRNRNKKNKNKKDEQKNFQNFNKNNNAITEVSTGVANTVICLDSEPEIEDDDVIEIPRSPIPMICLEDSDAEIDQPVEKVERVKTPVEIEEKLSTQENETELNVEQNKSDTSVDDIQKVSTSVVEDADNCHSTSKSKKRQKKTRENVKTSEHIEGEESQVSLILPVPEDASNLEQNATDIETNVTTKGKKRQKRKRENIEDGESQELQDSNLEQNTTGNESNSFPKRKKREKKKRESLKNVADGTQSEANTSVNIEDDIQKLQASILQKVFNSQQNTSTSNSKKRQKRNQEYLENALSSDQDRTDTPRNTVQNISTPMKSINPSPSKKRSKKKRNRQDLENSEDNESIIENCEKNIESPKNITIENTKESPVQSTPSKNIEFATPKSKKRQKARNKKNNNSQLSEGSDDFLMHTTDLESNQSIDSVLSNDTIISTNILKKNITIPQTLIPDIYETESSCSDIFEKDNPEQNQQSTSKRPFAELDLIQFADMITTSRSKENQGSDSIVCAKTSQNCNQTTSVSFSADNCHRVIATDRSKFHFEDTSSSSDESEVVEKNKSLDIIKNASQSTITKSLESIDLSYEKFRCQNLERGEFSTDESETKTRIENDLESDQSKNIAKSTLSQINGESTTQNSLVPLNNDEQGETTIDVNYEQFINQLENKIRNSENSETLCTENSKILCTDNSETVCTNNSESVCNSPNNINEITEILSQSLSDNDSDVECVTPITTSNDNNPVISIDSDHDSIITINESEVTDTGDICLNVSDGEMNDAEKNQNRLENKSNTLNISKEEERAHNLKMRFHTYWTPNREIFYNRSWGGETYDHEQEQYLMPGSRKDWAISIDKKRKHRSFESKVRCRNCRQQGHVVKNCPVPIKPCTMCGSRQHREFKCDESCCLTCFSKFRRSFTSNCKRCLNWRNICCKMCNNKGHVHDYCPDLWRRYHLTVKPGQIIQPIQKNQNKSANWCSICATKGHSSDKCRYYHNVSQTPPDSLQVKQYSDVYDYNGTSPKRRKCNGGEDDHWNIHQVKLNNENCSFLAIDQENSTQTTRIVSNFIPATEKIDTCDLTHESISSSESDLIETVPTTPNVTKHIQSMITKSNATELNETKSVTTVPISSEFNFVLPLKNEFNVPESNKIESLTTKPNDVEQITTESVAIESIPTATLSGTKSTDELIITKSSDTEGVVPHLVLPNPVVDETNINLPNVTQSVLSIGSTESDPLIETAESVTPTKQVIVKTNMFGTGSMELKPNIAISSTQAVKKNLNNKKFYLDLPLNEQEEQRVHRENFLKTLTKGFHANVYIKTKRSNRLLHITASEQYRDEIENCLREFLSIKNPDRRPSNNFQVFIKKVRNDYPLIEEVYNLEDPYALYQAYTRRMRIKGKKPLQIIKKLNVFRKIHCQQTSEKTRESLEFLRNIYNGEPVPINLRTKVKKAYYHIFRNTDINKLDEVINEFNLHQYIQQQSPSKITKSATSKKSTPVNKKEKNQKKIQKPIQKSTVSSTNDMELIKYANMLELATNIPKYKTIIKRCKHRYAINKEFSEKNLRSLMAVGAQLKIPFHT